jgi:hypothetical protein
MITTKLAALLADCINPERDSSQRAVARKRLAWLVGEHNTSLTAFVNLVLEAYLTGIKKGRIEGRAYDMTTTKTEVAS